ncbi:MAG: sodium:solute symporter [bacterium]
MEEPTAGLIRMGDLITLSIYLVGTLGLGLWFGIKTKTTEGYFLGSRKMPGWAVGISLLGTAISSITFLAYPGSAYDGNFSRIVPGLAFPIGAMAAIFIFVPFYRKTGFVSAYTYFEHRFGLWGRVYVCALFSLGQIWRMGLILYLLSMAIKSMHPELDLQMVILIIGTFVTIYTVLGGIEAVIWTDVFQTLCLILGGFAVIVVAFMSIDGGASTVFSMGAANGKFSLIGEQATSALDLSLARDTLLMLILVGSIGSICEFALDQTHIQRYCAASTDAGARRAVWIGAMGCVPVWLLFMFVGTCLWVFYQTHPGAMHREMLADEVFPYFILTQLPNGMGGVVIAGVLAAAMSSIDSSMSGMTSVVTEDIYKRILFRGREDSHYLKAAKVIATMSGVLMIVVAAGLTLLRQEAILDLCFILGSVLGAGFGGLFMIGFFTMRTNSFGAAIGVILSTLVTFGMTFTEAKAMLYDSRVSWMIEYASESGEVDTEAIKAEIVAKAKAQGITLKLADIQKAEKERVRDFLSGRIVEELGAQPPHLGDVMGVHPFAMGLISNLFAFVFGYLFSFLRPPKPTEELMGYTWWTRHVRRSET